MIIMDVRVDNLYAFKNFHINMSYPKKIVDSSIPDEFLKERTNFRYKKVNIIMGGNSTGKTTFGKVLMLCANYMRDGSYSRFLQAIDDKEKNAAIKVDFVTEENILYRLSVKYLSKPSDDKKIKINIYYTPINKKDNYEICAKRLDEHNCEETSHDKVNLRGWHFSYPQDVSDTEYVMDDDERYLCVLKYIMKTLDPSIQNVVKVKEVDKTYAILYDNQSVLIKDGKIENSNVLSSGTKAGIDIAYIIASLYSNKHSFYYCDERFTYVNSDIEKACLSIMIDKIKGRKQLFFTTHNTDILDMQLPIHSYTFFKKDIKDKETNIKTIYADDYLKRNTDSLKNAVENDLFGIAPELDKLYHIDEI